MREFLWHGSRTQSWCLGHPWLPRGVVSARVFGRIEAIAIEKNRVNRQLTQSDCNMSNKSQVSCNRKTIYPGIPSVNHSKSYRQTGTAFEYTRGQTQYRDIDQGVSSKIVKEV